MKKCTLLLSLYMLTSLTVLAQQKINEAKGYFSASAEYGYGYFYNWDNSVAEETNIRLAGQELLSSQDKFGFSTQLKLSRHTKRDKLSYGIGYYYYFVEGTYDGVYFNEATGLPKARLLDWGVSESGHTLVLSVSPSLYRSERWRISSTLATGFIWLSLASVTIPTDNRPVVLRDRTRKNAGMEGGYLALAGSASYALNPYFRLFGRARWNFQWDTGQTLLVEPVLGIEVPLVAAGRRYAPRG